MKEFCINSERQTVNQEGSREAIGARFRRVIGPIPNLKEINLVCWGMFIALLFARFLFSLWVEYKTGVGSFHILPADFIYFYGIGHIANEYPLTRLYDYSLQVKVFNEIFPITDGAYGPSPYPPFVALFFSPFARLPIIPAYYLWAGISLLLYLTGIGAVVRSFFRGEPLKASLIFCFALVYAPFLHNTLANGQISTFAVCAVGIAIANERQGKPLSCGLSLAFLVYKPSLLLLIIPMLLLTRRFRTFFGFILGATILGCATTAIEGIEIWPAYVHFLSVFGRIAGFHNQSVLNLTQYIDLRASVLSVWGNQSVFNLVIFILATSLIVAALAVALWKSATAGRPAQDLAWAITLTWTLLINLYVPAYDSILISISAILTLGALRDLDWSLAKGWSTALLVFISVASWGTYQSEKSHSGQLLTFTLAILGLFQLYILFKAAHRDSPFQTQAPRPALVQDSCAAE
jgi:hypothetical protein